MDRSGPTGPKRYFAGRREAPPPRQNPFDVLAETLLSPRVAEASAPPPAPPEPRERAARLDRAAAPEGLYVLVPAGIEPDDRRRTVLEVARHLAPPDRPTAIFVFDGSTVDAHVFGEVAGGRPGPQNDLTAADIDRTIVDLVGQCAQVGIALVGEADGALKRLGPAARQTVFVSRPDAESIVETYREMKAWRQGGARAEASLLVLGGEGDDEAARVHRRLRKTVRAFLGCDLAIQGYLASVAAEPTVEHRQPLSLFSQTPADQVWARLLAATQGELASAGSAAAGPATESSCAAGLPCATAGLSGHAAACPGDAPRPDPGMRPAPAVPAAARRQEGAPADICPVFSVWQPADRAELLAAIEAQAPSVLATDLRVVFRVDVDEPGAPPLAAVRADGTLVAILVTAPGEAADTAAAERWLAVHRSLLVRAYPSAGIAAEGGASAVVLAPLQSPPPDGLRRFLPVRMGGHRGVVILP
jgi:hypothetical protein